MSRWLNSYSRAFQRLLPSPMAIALTLTVVAFISALFVSEPVELVKAWSDGFWNPGLMRFGFQAMFMLVLGHVLALSKPVRSGKSESRQVPFAQTKVSQCQLFPKSSHPIY